jgi:hypothetical protein
MKRNDLENFVGKVVCLDLTNRERPVGRLIKIRDDDVAILKNPLIYVPIPVKDGMNVQALTYAAPLFDVKILNVELINIIDRIDLPSHMEQDYVRRTSSIITENKPSIIVP